VKKKREAENSAHTHIHTCARESSTKSLPPLPPQDPHAVNSPLIIPTVVGKKKVKGMKNRKRYFLFLYTAFQRHNQKFKSILKTLNPYSQNLRILKKYTNGLKEFILTPKRDEEK